MPPELKDYLAWLPIVGDAIDIKNLIDSPSLSNAGFVALDAASYIPILGWGGDLPKPQLN